MEWSRWVRSGRSSGLLCRGSRLKGCLWDWTGPALESKAISSHVTVPVQRRPNNHSRRNYHCHVDIPVFGVLNDLMLSMKIIRFQMRTLAQPPPKSAAMLHLLP